MQCCSTTPNNVHFTEIFKLQYKTAFCMLHVCPDPYLNIMRLLHLYELIYKLVLYLALTSFMFHKVSNAMLQLRSNILDTKYHSDGNKKV